MFCAVGVMKIMQMKRYSWLLAVTLLGMVSHAFAEVPRLPPFQVYDYQSLGSPENKELYFVAPKGMELFDDSKILKPLCVNLGGLSIGWAKKDESKENGVSREWLFKMFKEYFAQNDTSQELDQCHNINNGHSQLNVADPTLITSEGEKLKKTDDKKDVSRLLLQFKNNGSRWVSLWSIAQFTQCITKKYHQKTSSESIRQNAEEPVDFHCDVQPQEHSFLSKLFFADQKESDYFLSRAFLPAQNLCGINVNMQDSLEQAKRCQVPELVRVELVEGRVGKIFITYDKEYKTIPLTVIESLLDNKKNNIDQLSESLRKISEDVQDNTIAALVGEIKESKPTDKLPVDLDDQWKKIISKDNNKEKFSEIVELMTSNYFYFTYTFDILNKYIKLSEIISQKEKDNIKKSIDNLSLFTSVECNDMKKDDYLKISDFSSKLCKIVKPLQEQKPINRLKLERVLMQASDLPGISINSILEPSLNDAEIGVSGMMIIPKNIKYIELSAGFDNYGNDYMGPNLYWDRFALNHIFTPSDTFSWLYVRTRNEDQLSHHQLDYKTPITFLPSPFESEGFYGRLNFLKDDAHLGGVIENLDINVKNTSYGMALGHTEQTHLYMKNSMEGGLQFTDIKTTLLGSELSDDLITKIFVKADFDYYNQNNEKGNKPIEWDDLPGLKEMSISVKGAHGVRWEDHYKLKGDFRTSRPDAGPNFFQLQVKLKTLREFERINNLSDEWLPKFVNFIIPKSVWRFYAAGEMGGQWSSEPLFSPEEMSFGGRNFGAAYESGKIAGDHAFAIKGELGYKILTGFSYDTKDVGEKPVINGSYEFSPFGFLEFAQVWNKDDLDKFRGTENDEILSGGGGLRVQVRPKFLEWWKRKKENNKNNFLAGVIPINQISIEVLHAWPLGGMHNKENKYSPETRGEIMIQFFVPGLDG